MSAQERGAAMVEAVIVLPVLLLLIFSIIEVGGMLRSYSGTASAVRNGGRSASLAAADSMADAQILAKVARQADSMGRDEVQFVVVWHASGPGEAVPPACLPVSYSSPNSASVGHPGTGPGAMGACSAYLAPNKPGGAFAMAEGTAVQPTSYYFGCAGPSDPDAWHKLDCNWPPTSRQVLTSPRGAVTPYSTDFVGIYLQARHDSYTGILGSGVTITDQSITLIEPQGYALS